jgi:beta-lactamase superfamily II metal-dependent hydrolase
MRIRGKWLAAFAVLSVDVAAAAPAKTLDIYFIDVEGGQSTLLVSPGGKSLLIDTGWSGDGQSEPGNPAKARDANRILAAAHEAGISAIDHLLITHFHPDHFGGVLELAQLMPIRHFIDHGSPAAELLADRDYRPSFDSYVKLRNRSPHLEPKPGDRLPLAAMTVTVVSSAGHTLVKPLAGAGKTNVACRSAALPAGDPLENPRSTGVLVEFGRFRFLDVGDLSGQPLFNLVCPNSLIGPVDVYLVAGHGGEDSADPANYGALIPRVAVMNNGLNKGGDLAAYEALHHVPGLEDVWQLHWSKKAGERNFAAERIANPDESTAYWIKLSANEDGSFRVLNGRTGLWRSYPARSKEKND